MQMLTRSSLLGWCCPCLWWRCLDRRFSGSISRPNCTSQSQILPKKVPTNKQHTASPRGTSPYSASAVVHAAGHEICRMATAMHRRTMHAHAFLALLASADSHSSASSWLRRPRSTHLQHKAVRLWGLATNQRTHASVMVHMHTTCCYRGRLQHNHMPIAQQRITP